MQGLIDWEMMDDIKISSVFTGKSEDGSKKSKEWGSF